MHIVNSSLRYLIPSKSNQSRNLNVFFKKLKGNRSLENKRLTAISKYWIRYDYVENKNIYYRPINNPYMSNYYKLSPKSNLIKKTTNHMKDIFLL